MAENLTRQLIAAHLVEGEMRSDAEIALGIDQVLVHDATGPLCSLQLEAIGVERTEVATTVAHMDHLTVEADSRNADDHLLLRSAAQRFGWYLSHLGNGISHVVHQQRFGVPGATMLGADSHTPAAGAIGMLAIGAGGLEISLAMAGEPFRLPMPQVWGIELVGELPASVSAKDAVLELLRRHGVDGGRGRIIEYHGPGLASLSVMDRHVMGNMGTEAGAVTTVFPSDGQVRHYLRTQGRAADWRPLAAQEGSGYDVEERIDLSTLQPLIALPSSPGHVVPVAEVAGQDITQAYIGSSANPGYRDIAVVAAILDGHRIAPGVSLDVNPASRQALRQLIEQGLLGRLVASGARLHQTGCNGCIGMGQAPATGRRSLRTVPRNFPGRSGGEDDQIYLCSPETAAASARTGVITDPRTLRSEAGGIEDPGGADAYTGLIEPPRPSGGARPELVRGPGHVDVPDFDSLPDSLDLPVLLHLGDDVSTDAIMQGGTEGMSLWSRIDAMTDLTFVRVDDTYPTRARDCPGGHAIVAGRNYGQGSSREQAALAARNLGLRVVLAHTIARIHGENLVNYGVLPLSFDDPVDSERLGVGARVTLPGLHDALRGDRGVVASYSLDDGSSGEIRLHHELSPRQVDILLAGGAIPWLRARRRSQDDRSPVRS